MTKITKEDPVPGSAPDLWQPEDPDELPDPHALLACWETANCGYAEQQQLVADRWRLWRLARDLVAALDRLINDRGDPGA